MRIRKALLNRAIPPSADHKADLHLRFAISGSDTLTRSGWILIERSLNVLKRYHSDLAQRHYSSKALSADELISWIKKSNWYL